MRSLTTQSTALKTLFAILFTVFSGYWIYSVISLYFRTPTSPSHEIESLTGFWIPIVFSLGVLAIYEGYRWYRLSLQGHTSGMSLKGVIMSFIGIHLLACIAYGSYISASASGGAAQISALSIAFPVWIKSLGFSVIPLTLLLVTSATGYKLLECGGVRMSARVSRSSMILLSGALGMAGYLILLSILGALGFFTLPLAIFVTIAYAAIGIGSYGVGARALISSSNSQICSSSDLSRSVVRHIFGWAVMIFFASFLISILRPVPIGWDDLGVYMNYPRLIALSGDGAHMGLVAWQHFTALGFLLGSPTQAFYLSELGGLMMAVATYLGLKILLDEHGGRSSIAPAVGTAAMISLPMVVFHLAKDMKVDPALYALSVAAFVALCVAFRLDRRSSGLPDTHDFSLRDYLGLPQSRLIMVAGLLTGVAFAVKLTTLMLLIAGIVMIAFRYARKRGMMAVILAIFGVFTFANLWKFLNLDILGDQAMLRYTIGATLLVIAALLLGSILLGEHRARLRTMSVMIALFVTSFALSLSPWLIKNLCEVGFAPTSLGQVLTGKNQAFNPDLSRIYTPEELLQKEHERSSHITSASGKTANEDLGRYMGYEDGLNNALKLPRNLTTQVNQAGEFTNIGFFFLSLVPLALLAFFRHRLIAIGMLAGFIMMSLYYFVAPTQAEISAFFATIQYPLGYAIIFGLVLMFLLTLLVAYRNSEDDSEGDSAHLRDIRAVIVGLSVYAMLFWVSSFGIVWYGILIYFLFLVVIFAGARVMDREFDELLGDRLHLMTSISALVIGFFVFIIAIPHSWTNIKTSSYTEYKIGQITSEASVFMYRDGYLDILSRLNIADESKAVESVVATATQEQIRSTIARYQPRTLSELDAILSEIERQIRGSSNTIMYTTDIGNIRQTLYRYVLTPPADNINHDKIYRIGTFLTYFIRENNTRYFDDSLVMEYERIIASKDDDLAAKRLEGLGVNYLLLDLNAATIDKDPTKKLTTRYEALLANMRSDRLRLVYSDSLCLKLALHEKKSLSREEYILLAHTNSESYMTFSGSDHAQMVSRTQKVLACREAVKSFIMSDTASVPDFLQSYRAYIKDQKITDEKKIDDIIAQIVPPSSWMALFEIIKDPKQSDVR